MQSIPSNEAILSDLADAYQQIKEVVARLKSVFDKVEDDAILDGKAISLTRLLQSALRAQIQLIGKIERYQKSMDSAPLPQPERIDNVGHYSQKRSVQSNSSHETKPPKLSRVEAEIAPARSLMPPPPKRLASLLKEAKQSRRNQPCDEKSFPAPGLLMR